MLLRRNSVGFLNRTRFYAFGQPLAAAIDGAWTVPSTSNGKVSSTTAVLTELSLLAGTLVPPFDPTIFYCTIPQQLLLRDFRLRRRFPYQPEPWFLLSTPLSSITPSPSIAPTRRFPSTSKCHRIRFQHERERHMGGQPAVLSELNEPRIQVRHISKTKTCA
ncbi:hypothetical protein GOP47_0006401 [Adiantum capillus-veneris]|uniref:Uncharacterized protein n=1 Tax=Adiantum capillus-veneris TaxID=13818 RepID=A0A9D4ZN03_ADICA|nr:hypothetical protein GOP47_0006401 [Adiantum capillus-veneris]